MEKIKNFFSKYGMIAFISLFLIMSMRNCNKNSKINRQTKTIVNLEQHIDSLIQLIPTDHSQELLKLKSEYKVYNRLNDEISKLDRHGQMMDFQQKQIIPFKEKIENKIIELEQIK